MHTHILFRLSALAVLLLGILLISLQLLGTIPVSVGTILVSTGVISASTALFFWGLHNPLLPHAQYELRKGIVGVGIFGVIAVITLLWGGMALLLAA
jgi:hypothetical protein